MAKFTIERGTGDITIEADEYALAGGYFWFRDDSGNDVHTVRAEEVISVTREN